jgi:hypothetical protein
MHGPLAGRVPPHSSYAIGGMHAVIGQITDVMPPVHSPVTELGMKLPNRHDREPMALGDLGVSAADEVVHHLVLDLGSCTVSDVAKALQVDEAEANGAICRLTDLGLLEPTGTGRVTAGNPQSALDRLAERRIAESLTGIHRIATLRSAWPQVLDGLGAHASMVERIAMDGVTERIVAELKSSPPMEVRSAKSGKPIRRIGDAGYTATVELPGRGVKYRTMVGPSQNDIHAVYVDVR